MRKLFLTIVALLFFTIVATPPAMAVGTAVSTTISNQAYGDYKDANGNDMARAYSNTVTITVAQVYAVRLNPTSASASGGNELYVYYSSRLYNDGNGPDTQTFTVTSTGGTWAPTSYTVYRDVNDNGVYDAGTDTVITPSGGNYTTASIAADGYFPIIIAILTPDNPTAGNGTSNQSTLTTTSNGDPTKTISAIATTTILAAVISASKGHVSVVTGTTTPKGTPTYRPGDEVLWTVTMSNTGSITATKISAIDNIPAGVTFVPGSIQVKSPLDADWQNRNDACGDNTEACYDAGNNRIVIPGMGAPGDSPYFLPAGTSYGVRIKVTINAGVPWNTTVSNFAAVTFTSGGSTVTVNTNTDSFVVQQLAGITMTKLSTNQAGDPSDVIVYRFDVTNAGNKTDSFDITTNSSNAWTWAYWVDVDNNGIPGTDGDYLLTDTNGNGTVDTGNILQSGVIHLLAVATIPAGRSNGTTDTLTVTGTSYADATKTANVQWTTTVNAPVLAVTKELVLVHHTANIGGSVPPDCVPTNKQTPQSPANCSFYPGSVVTYQITARNNGNGDATNLVLTDAIPANMTYKTGTIRAGNSVGTLTAKTDASDGDGGRFDGGSVMSGAGSVINLGPGATWVLEFQATIN